MSLGIIITVMFFIALLVFLIGLYGALRDKEIKLEAEKKAREVPMIPIQEAWEAAGGNPNIKATKKDLIEALRTLDQVCDFCDANHRDTNDRTRNQ